MTPRSPQTPCTADPRCPNLVPVPGPCAEHRREKRARRTTDETWAVYGADWPTLRQKVLREEPTCRLCASPSTDVDHIIPLRDGGTNARANLQALCHSHHSRKTARENRFGGARD